MRSAVTFLIVFSCCAWGVTAINSYPSQNFSIYHDQALDPKNTMDKRWQAVFSAAHAASATDLNKIKSFTDRPEWFIRNAALLALNKVDRPTAEITAKKLISDKALVVRSAAVDVLADNSLERNRALLSSELSKPYNFNKKVSLWIRPQIMEKLAKSAKLDQKKFFAGYLYDRDPQVVQYSMNALESITGITYSGAQRLSSWKNYVRNKKLVN